MRDINQTCKMSEVDLEYVIQAKEVRAKIDFRSESGGSFIVRFDNEYADINTNGPWAFGPKSLKELAKFVKLLKKAYEQ